MAAGFIVGQVEKVYLGACPAAMFAIPPRQHLLREFVGRDMARIYGIFPVVNPGGDVWVFRNKETYRLLQATEVPGVSFEITHVVRGFLCGIPANEVDPKWKPGRSLPTPSEPS